MGIFERRYAVNDVSTWSGTPAPADRPGGAPAELFISMVAAFSDAEQLIRQGRCREAKAHILSLPEPVYELALDWYTKEHKDYYYYLVRYVLDSFEYKVMYCHKAGLEEHLASYGELLESLSAHKPTKVYLKGKLFEFKEEQLTPPVPGRNPFAR